MELTKRQKLIVDQVLLNPGTGISGIQKLIKDEVSTPTLNRDLKELTGKDILIKSGAGKNTVYTVAPTFKLLHHEIDDSYFDKDIDERIGNKKFDPGIIDQLKAVSIFTKEEIKVLGAAHEEYRRKIEKQSPTLIQKEMERLTIELSWKSSQIEGNTYTLLETELLLNQQQEAENKEKDEATMLLNHKEAMNYLFEQRISLSPLKVTAIEDIHSILAKGLGVKRNLRERLVGITGTTYRPPDNQYQIRDYLNLTCDLINGKEFTYEKALLAVLLISLIQPFEDGNKRTGRITANGILIYSGYCPLSYRSVKAMDYKKATLLFYEQSSISAFKKIFIEQAVFAVKNYF